MPNDKNKNSVGSTDANPGASVMSAGQGNNVGQGSDTGRDGSREMPETTVDVELNRIVEKVKDADSILVALSKNPTVDEIAAALGLTLALSRMGKHATAIYSGETPNVLAFLEPEKTFETNTNSLQDFIIALNKEKADHLRYKIEGDFVKVYITPYKTTIDEKDLEFSHGDVNVDLVISINVEEEEDLDAALATHGRIMHDAGAVNISNAVPGRLGGIEWNKTNVSSVSEMIVQLIDELKEQITEDVATALLTGIEAATERFSNEKTTPEAMSLASKLMEAGADQQLIVSNIMQSAKEDEAKEAAAAEEKKAKEVEPGTIEVDHDEAPEMSAVPEIALAAEDSTEAPVNVASTSTLESVSTEQPVVEPASAEQQLTQMMTGAPAMTEEPVTNPVTDAPATETPLMGELPATDAPVTSTIDAPAAVPTAQVPVNEIYQTPTEMTNLQDGTVPEVLEQPKDYGAMMEEALAEPMMTPAMQPEMPAYDNPAIQAAPEAPAQPEVQPVEPMQPLEPNAIAEPVQPVEPIQPTEPMQPVEPVQPEMPELPQPPTPDMNNYAMPPMEPMLPPVQMPEQMTQQMTQATPEQILSEQMANQVPPVDESSLEGIPTGQEAGAQIMSAEPVNPVIVQPESSVNPESTTNLEPTTSSAQTESNTTSNQPVQDPTLVPPVQDPGAFKIPGM